MAEVRLWRPCRQPRDTLKQVATVPVRSETNQSCKQAAVVLTMLGEFRRNHCEEIGSYRPIVNQSNFKACSQRCMYFLTKRWLVITFEYRVEVTCVGNEFKVNRIYCRRMCGRS